jgi:hypothetical protein
VAHISYPVVDSDSATDSTSFPRSLPFATSALPIYVRSDPFVLALIALAYLEEDDLLLSLAMLVALVLDYHTLIA